MISKSDLDLLCYRTKRFCKFYIVLNGTNLTSVAISLDNQRLLANKTPDVVLEKKHTRWGPGANNKWPLLGSWSQPMTTFD